MRGWPLLLTPWADAVEAVGTVILEARTVPEVADIATRWVEISGGWEEVTFKRTGVVNTVLDETALWGTKIKFYK